MFILLRDDEGRDELGIGLPRKRLSLPVERPKSVQKVVKSIVNGLVMYVLVQFVLPLLLTMAITDDCLLELHEHAARKDFVESRLGVEIACPAEVSDHPELGEDVQSIAFLNVE